MTNAYQMLFQNESKAKDEHNMIIESLFHLHTTHIIEIGDEERAQEWFNCKNDGSRMRRKKTVPIKVSDIGYWFINGRYTNVTAERDFLIFLSISTVEC